MELISSQASLTNNDGTHSEAESCGMAPAEDEEKEHEMIKAPCTPPSHQEQGINFCTEELDTSEIAKGTTELVSFKVSVRNNGCASHEAVFNGISNLNEKAESQATTKNQCVPPSLILVKTALLSTCTPALLGDSDIDTKISLSSSGNGEPVPQELQQISAFNEETNGLAAVLDSSEMQSVQ